MSTPLLTANTDETSPPLREYVLQTLHNYFSQLGDHPIVNLYELVLAEVELPLLETVLRQVRGNQSKAAIVLGISRGTLRKKLKQYNLG
jgi:Fis family transcriptional regulator